MSQLPATAELTAELLTKADVARICRVSIFTVDRWTSRRTGPKFYRMNKRIRFKLPDVMAFVDQHAVNPAPDGTRGSKAKRTA